jgi:meiotically up-regulated gene 157 (Mug157) protein
VRKDKEEAKTKNITDENDSFLWFLRAVDSALDLFHEVVGGNRFERFGRHIFIYFFVLFLWFCDESKTKSNKI